MKILKDILSVAAIVLSFPTFFFVLFNGIAIFTGFENDSPACYEVRNHTQSNFSYYFFPISSHACKPNAGLLQPALSDAFNWLGDTHK